MAASPIPYVSISNVIIDDIVLWDGRTMMATLGGSGTHAVMGMRIWHTGPLGLIAYLGEDFSASMQRDLARLHVDPRGLITRSGVPTPRAWQLFEANGHRTEVFRTPVADFYQRSVRFDEIPSACLEATGYHIQFGRTIGQAVDLLESLRAANPRALIVFEPLDEFLDRSQAEWQPLLRLCDVFLPNEEEAHRLTGYTAPRDMAQALQTWGTGNVVIRMAEKGVWVQAATGDAWRIPAVPAQVVDVTGAGNAFCGGMLTGMGAGLDLREASLRGVVSAGFTIEQFGVPPDFAGVPARARQRLAWARDKTETA